MRNLPSASWLFCLFALLLTGCSGYEGPLPDEAEVTPARFPLPDRPVADIVSATWSDEATRDSSGEADKLFDLLDIGLGNRIADIGAGIGYYTIRLARRVGPDGQVYANDIMPDYLARLRRRILDQGLSNVTLVLGDPGNARLAPESVDVAIMAHMYHEISDPFGLLWYLHDSLRPGGRVAIVDADRATTRHGTPESLLICEMAAAGFRLTASHNLHGDDYLAIFVPDRRPDPEDIRPCPATEGN